MKYFGPLNISYYIGTSNRWCCARPLLGGQLVTTLLASIFIIFFSSFSVLTFSHQRTVQLKTYLAKVDQSTHIIVEKCSRGFILGV